MSARFKIDMSELDVYKFIHPLIAGLLLNAYYSALNLKKISGVSITPEVEEKTFLEVFERYRAIRTDFAETIAEAESSRRV